MLCEGKKEREEKMGRNRVLTAKPYRCGSLGSSDRTAYMLIRMHQFPDVFDDRDEITASADSDRMFDADYSGTRRCFKEHTGHYEMYFKNWVMSASPEQIMAFLIDVLRPSGLVNAQWTGFRILGSVHQGNGFVVWSFQLFAKHPDGDTKVYDDTDKDAPNVERLENSNNNYDIFGYR
jgi:hypothetical protein